MSITSPVADKAVAKRFRWLRVDSRSQCTQKTTLFSHHREHIEGKKYSFSVPLVFKVFPEPSLTCFFLTEVPEQGTNTPQEGYSVQCPLMSVSAIQVYSTI